MAALGASAAGAQQPAAPAVQAPATVTPAKPAPAPRKPPRRPAPNQDDDPEVSEVVVTAGKTIYQQQPGAVVGDIEPEIQLSPREIQSYGVATVTELLDELAPETRSDRGRGGETPVVLLNGRRISGFNEIRDIPTEAILRIDILPEEVSLKYGFTADQRVVNIVLRRRFRAFTADLRGGGPTEGGEVTGQVEGDDFRVRGDNRFNLDVKYNGNTDLTENARGLTEPAAGAPYAVAGNVVGMGAGGEIDPALSALAGKVVTVAGVPAAAASRALALSDFVGTAGVANGEDDGRYRSLVAAAQSVSANAVLARTLPAGFSGTVNATLGATSSDSLRGLPSLGLTVPAGDPFSPFGTAVNVDRYITNFGPLRQDVDGWTAHLGGTLNRDLGKWRLSFTTAYDHADSSTVSDVGLDSTGLQGLLKADSTSFNPFVAPPASLLALLPRNNARSISDTGNLQALANGPTLKLPAGAIYVSLKAGDTQSGFDTRSSRLGVVQAVGLSRNDANIQANFDLPVFSRRHNVVPFLGEVSLNANLAVDQISNFGTLHATGYGVNWQPITGVTLLYSRTLDSAPPTVQQLGNPVVLTAGARILDYATGQTVDVTQITGGNPSLVSDHRDISKIGVTWKPIDGQNLTITANYIVSRIDSPFYTFPVATAQIEAAFPDRFIRDATGELVEVDERPVNFTWTRRSEIRWGVNYSRPIGKPPPPRAIPFRRPGDGQAAGQRRAPNGAGAPDAPPDGAPPPPGGPDGAPPAPGAGGGPGGGGGGGGGRGGFGAGPGGGGRGPGGGRGGGGFGQGPTQGQFQVALYHTFFFSDQMLARPGGPLLDLLNGAPASATGGQPQQQIELQAGYTYNNLGARISGNWLSGTTVAGGAASGLGTLNFSDIATLNLRLFANAGAMRSVVRKHPWLRGARITLNITNLFDQRIRVTDATGATPLSYQPAYLDPTGRAVTLSVRKLFF
jgi:hypothetical protein